ncbi:unnamed protein product [Didymodactylos carnosus]|uniref:LamG-like jellyroll fold domain-containing protein n=1 Tax=Didymodactylos carnosus TaxID=1234261 RepID=A0A815EGY6_9BILA|nr:unnamed protein product [Didymodactylos carnosus]CAF4146215.1 unnamed protein product [Didymodactylos carnosus]
MTSSTKSLVSFWSFDGDATDLFNTYNGVLYNKPTFKTGYVGQAIAFTGGNQYVQTPFVNLAYQSFTIEAWVYLTTLAMTDSSIFGECTAKTTGKCLQLVIRNKLLYMDFYGHNTTGRTTLQINTWYHVAFVYDENLQQQSVYLNGTLDGQSTQSIPPYLGTCANVTIGTIQNSVANNYFIGSIDHLSINNRAKSQSEVLSDATLVAYYSFDNGSLLDSGPNRLNGTAVGVRSGATVPGRVNQALLFNSSAAYFQAFGFTSLGISNHAFSISIWIKPIASTSGGTILIVSSTPLTNSGWCLQFLAMSANGILTYNSISSSYIGPSLTQNVWSHIALTYSQMNGLQLYQNGALYASNPLSSYSASTLVNYVTLGNSRSSSGCSGGLTGPFKGYIDEFRVFSRELSQADVSALANP